MIRIEKTDDFKILAELNKGIQKQHAEKYPHIFKDYNTKDVQAAFFEMLSKNNISAYIARKNDTPIAYLILIVEQEVENAFKHARSFLYIDQIFVLKEFRNKGVGSMLMNTAFALAKEGKLYSIELDHWSDNKSVNEFFRKFDFNNLKERMQRVLK